MSNLLQKGVMYLNLLKVKIKKVTDPEFNLFLTLNQDKNLENINSKRKLEYLKTIDLSKQGFINPDRKTYFKQEKKLYQLLDIDQNIKMIGKVSLTKGENDLQTQVFVGFNPKTNKLFLSDSHVKEIPIWKKPSANQVQELFKNVSQGLEINKENKLKFDHKFFKDDVEALDTNVKINLEREFNKIADIAFRSNKYIEKSYPILPEDLSRTEKKYIGETFKVPSSIIPSLSGKSEFVVATLKNKSEGNYVFEPLISSPKNNLIVASREKVENTISSRKIELAGKINSNIAIGYNKKDGSTEIGVKTNGSGYVWKPFEDIKYSVRLTDHEKEAITQIVDKKDFLLEKDKVVLTNPNNTDQKVLIKKHCSKPGLYYMEAYGNKSNSLNNYDKLSSKQAQLLAVKYKGDSNIKTFKKLAEEENVIKKQEGQSTWKDITKAAAGAVHHRR